LPATLFLVTSGFRRLQASKVRALGIAKFFKEVHIDAIDEPERLGKLGIFQRIKDQNNLDSSEVVVVGDNPESEIEAGHALGLHTVQILRPGVSRGTNADQFVHSLKELLPLFEPSR